MKIRKSNSEDSIQDIEIKYSSSPKTHFFYEYEGERSVDPSVLIASGVTLWHEQMLSNEVHDTSHLWAHACALLDARVDSPIYSHIEWLRYQITMGVIAPEKWDHSKPYPYKGMLISAIYFLEARRLCEEGREDRAWHVIAIAYYHLGINTTPTTTQSAANAALIKHAKRSEYLRALVMAFLKIVKEEDSAKSINDAIEEIIKLFENKPKAMAGLDEFDKSIPDNTKHEKENDALERLRVTLKNWAAPKGPYPEIAAAFSHFRKRKGKSTDNLTSTSNTRTTSAEVPVDESNYYMRLINILERGDVLTMKLSREEEA